MEFPPGAEQKKTENKKSERDVSVFLNACFNFALRGVQTSLTAAERGTLLVFWDMERPVITSPAEGPFCLRSLHPALSLSHPRHRLTAWFGE